MKQKLLFLIAFILLGTTAALAQTTINADNMSATYGDAPKNIGATFSPADAGATLKYSPSDRTVADVSASGDVTFKASSRLQQQKITITVEKGEEILATKDIYISIAPRNLEMTVTGTAVTNKIYDGNTLATLIGSAFGLKSGDLLAGDASGVSLDFSGVSANFETRDAGTNKNVILSQPVNITGNRAFCYTLTNALPALKANIAIASQPANLGLQANYDKFIGDLKLELTPSVREVALQYEITGAAGIVNVSIDVNNDITIDLLHTGTTTIKFYTDATNNYSAAEKIVTIEVKAPSEANDFTLQPSYTFTYGDAGTAIIPTDVKGNATVTYQVLNTDIATISTSGVLSIKKAGSTSIVVKTLETLNYAETTKTVPLIINPKSVSITGVSVKTKTYDGNTDAELIWTGASLSGVLAEDENKVAIDNSGVIVEFSSKNAGERSIALKNGSLSASLKAGTAGDQSANYSLSNGNLVNLSLKGLINKASQPANLGLQATMSAFVGVPVTLTPSVNGGTISYTSSANVAYSYTPHTITFSSPGTYTFNLYATDDDGNYSYTTGTITFTVYPNNTVIFSGVNSRSIEYGKNTEPLGVSASYSGGPVAISSYSSSNPAIVDVNAAGVLDIKAASGSATITVTVDADGSNHTSGTTTVIITAIPRKITLGGGITVTPKVYDGTTSATISNWTTSTITNKVGADIVDLGTQPTFAFVDKNVGTGKAMTISGGTLTGTDRDKYVLSAIGITGNITPKDEADNLGLPTSVSIKYGQTYTFPTPVIGEPSTVNITYSVPNENVIKIEDATTGSFSYKGTGTVTMSVATSPKGGGVITNYNSKTATIAVSVSPGTQIITAPAVINRILYDGTFQVGASALDNATLVYEAINNDEGIIEVNSSTGVVTPKKAGTATVLITAQATSLYAEKKQTVTINISENATITTQPTDQSICLGTPFTLSVVALGANTYEWYKGNIKIKNASGSSYTVNAAADTDAGSYVVKVSGTNGSYVISDQVTVTVLTSIAITTQPLAQTLCQGTKASFTVAATGDDLSYQWYKNGEPIGSDNSTFAITSIQASDSALYKVVVAGNGTCGPGSATSDSVRLGMIPSLPQTLSFYQSPDFLVKKDGNYTIIVGDRTKGYDGVSKYTWKYSTDDDAFALKETTSNTNELKVTQNTSNGTLSVTLTHVCGDKTMEKILKAVPLGIENVTAAGMRVYPNPVNSGTPMTIDLGDENTGATIYVYNVTGSLLMNANLTTQISTIPTTLKPGIYMMKIVVPNGKTAYHKFIVK